MKKAFGVVLSFLLLSVTLFAGIPLSTGYESGAMPPPEFNGGCYDFFGDGTILTNDAHSGLFAFQAHGQQGGHNSTCRFDFAKPQVAGELWIRAYIKFDTFPTQLGVSGPFQFLDKYGDNYNYLYVNADHTLGLCGYSGACGLPPSSCNGCGVELARTNPVNTGVWYRVEMHIHIGDISTGDTAFVEVFVYDNTETLVSHISVLGPGGLNASGQWADYDAVTVGTVFPYTGFGDVKYLIDDVTLTTGKKTSSPGAVASAAVIKK